MSDDAQPRNFDEEFPLQERSGRTFILGGQLLTTRKIVPPRIWLTPETNGPKRAIEVMREILNPESREIFNKMLESDDDIIVIEQLDEIAAWLIQELSKRPTESPA